MNSKSNLSIYIPRMNAAWPENIIKEIFKKNNIGIVSHVDFTCINKKPGFGEKVDGVVKSAFVHFKQDNRYDTIYNTAESKQFWEKTSSGEPYKIIIRVIEYGLGEYWICLKNKNPIQRTMMNIHQVVENGRHLENLLLKQSEEINDLKEKLEKQIKISDGMKDIIHQLLGGLFCQSTQKKILYKHLKSIGLENYIDYEEENSHAFDIWPTTRQGDDNSERITKLEYKFNEFLEKSKKIKNDTNNKKFIEKETKKNSRMFDEYMIFEDFIFH
jgi:hypothetical protein